MAKYKWLGDKVKKEVAKQAGQALFKGSTHILNEANRIAPHDEGILTQTAGVEVDEKKLVAHIFYTQKYAPRLHENPQFNFGKGREGKWLEKTMLNQHEKVLKFMADEIKKAFKG